MQLLNTRVEKIFSMILKCSQYCLTENKTSIYKSEKLKIAHQRFLTYDVFLCSRRYHIYFYDIRFVNLFSI